MEPFKCKQISRGGRGTPTEKDLLRIRRKYNNGYEIVVVLINDNKGYLNERTRKVRPFKKCDLIGDITNKHGAKTVSGI